MSNSFDLATGYVTFKGDFSQFEKDIVTSQEKLKVLQDSLKNPMAMRMAVGESMRLAKEFERAQKAAKRMVDEIRLGKMGVLLRDASAAFGKFQDRLKMVGAVGVGVGAGAMGLASAASPVAADTFQKSIKLAAATIGQDFVPAMMSVSFAIQDATRAWDQLNPAIKATVVEGVKMVAVAGAAAVALLGVTKVLSVIKSHPLLAAAGAGVAIGEFVNQRNNAAGAKQFAGAQKDVGGISWQDTLNDGQMQRLKGMGDKALIAAENDWRQKKKEYEDAATESNNYQKGWFGGGGWKAGVQRNNDFSGETQKTLIEKATRAKAEWVKSEMRWKGLANDPMAQSESNRTGIEGIMSGIVGGAAASKKKEGYDVAGMGPSSYGSLNEFYRTFNVAATSGDALDQKLLQIQTQTRDGILQMVEKLDKVVPAQ